MMAGVLEAQWAADHVTLIAGGVTRVTVSHDDLASIFSSKEGSRFLLAVMAAHQRTMPVGPATAAISSLLASLDAPVTLPITGMLDSVEG